MRCIKTQGLETLTLELDQEGWIIKNGLQVRIQGGGGGQGVRTPPPGNSQVISVSIGNKQLDPPLPLEKVGPPGEP